MRLQVFRRILAKLAILPTVGGNRTSQRERNADRIPQFGGRQYRDILWGANATKVEETGYG